MTDFGQGIFLNENFDLSLDNTGDIRLSEEIDELEKDIAVVASVLLQDELGQPMRRAALTRIETTARSALQEEDRINRVISVDAREVETNTAEVVASVVTESGDVELVFEV